MLIISSMFTELKKFSKKNDRYQQDYVPISAINSLMIINDACFNFPTIRTRIYCGPQTLDVSES